MTEAVTEMEAAVRFNKDNPRYLAYLGYAYAVAGRSKEAVRILDGLLAVKGAYYVPPTAIAHVFAGLGNGDPALAWLEKGLQERDVDLVGWAFRTYRSHPRYRQIYAAIGLAR